MMASRPVSEVPAPGGGAWPWIVALGLVAGCSAAPPDRTPDGRVIVNYWEKWTGFEGEAMQAVVDDFNASQDRILVDKLTVSQIDQKMLLATAGGNPPDVAGLWSPQHHCLRRKGRPDAAEPPPPGERASTARLHPGILGSVRIPGLHVGPSLHPGQPGPALEPAAVPRGGPGSQPAAPAAGRAGCHGRATDRGLRLRDGRARVKSGIPDSPTTEKAAREFTIIQMGYTPTWPGWWTPLWGYWFGGEFGTGTGTITGDAPEQLAAFQWYTSYAEKYGIDNLRRFSSSFGNFSSPQSPFLAGQVAMVLQGVWMYNFIDKYAPQLDWAAAPFPPADPERQPQVTLAECDVLVIPRGAPHPEEAFEFIRYVNSRPAMEKLCLGQRKFSPLAEYSEDFVATHPNPYLPIFIELARGPGAGASPRCRCGASTAKRSSWQPTGSSAASSPRKKGWAKRRNAPSGA